MATRTCCALISLLFVTCAALGDETTLRFVTVIWRHGDRAPSDGTFPFDTENGDSSWPQGFGELTPEGMRQHQRLGKYLRNRYVEKQQFLSPNYTQREIYIRSTSYNRTIMSALSNLAGMYPSDMPILDGIPVWQPIPVHSQPREIDPMLWMDCSCPTETQIFINDVMKSKNVTDIELENKDFLEFLKNNTGSKTMTLDDTWDIWDPLNCERIYNDTHHWPAWVNETVFERLTDLMQMSISFYYNDPRIQKLRGGLLFNDIANRLNQKAHRPETMAAELKYYVYSAHDTTIIALLENLGAFNAHPYLPEYASAILFELHEKTKGNFTVETWYVNETNPVAGVTNPVPILVRGCEAEEDCKLESFVKAATANSVTDWYAECFPPNTTTTTPAAVPDCSNAKQPALIAAIVLGVTTGVFMIAFIVTLIMFCRLRSNKVGHREH